MFCLSFFKCCFCFLAEELPRISVNDEDSLIMIMCETSRQSSDVSSCNLFIGEHLHNSTKSRPSSKIKEHSNCIFYVQRADLMNHLQGVSCNYRVNTNPPTYSARSDKYIIPGKYTCIATSL